MSKPFPLPNTNRGIAQAIPAPPGMVAPTMPLPASPAEEIVTVDSSIPEDEVNAILKTSLNPHHLADVRVIKYIQEFLRTRDNSDACLFAGIDKRSGYALRQKPDIHDAITRLTQKSLMKFGFDAEDIAEKVREISHVDIAELFQPSGMYKHPIEMAPEVRRVIKKFKIKYLYGPDNNGIHTKIGEVLEVELWDKLKAAELLAREKDLFTPTSVVKNDITENMSKTLLGAANRGLKRVASYRDVTPLALPPSPEKKNDGTP